jgi:hypothetical protein
MTPVTISTEFTLVRGGAMAVRPSLLGRGAGIIGSC